MTSVAALPELTLTASPLAIRRGGRIAARTPGFTLAPGGALALRGPNGAGKTSLLRALAGFCAVEEGEVSLTNADSALDLDEARQADFHFVGHGLGIKPGLAVNADLAFWAAYYGAAEANIETALDGFGIAHLAALPVSVLSAGQKKRLALSRLLIAPRALWLLDEPAAALDADGQALLLARIADHRAKGGAVILATHDAVEPPEAQTLRLDLVREAA